MNDLEYRARVLLSMSIIVAFALLLQPLAKVHAQSTNLEEIRTKIRELEQREAQLTDGISTSRELIAGLQGGRYLIVPGNDLGGPFPVLKDHFSRFLALRVLTGQMTPLNAAALAAAAGHATQQFVAELRRDLPALEAQLRKTQDDLSYFLDQRARLADATGCGVGRVWNNVESGHPMTFTRRGDSNIFVVSGTVNGKRFTAEQNITITGNRVSIHRYQASDGNTCNFTGTLQGNTASGTYACSKYQPSGGWSATISC